MSRNQASTLFIIITAFICVKCAPKLSYRPKAGLHIYDAHGHISLFNQNALDSLIKYNVYGVRDCGGDFASLKQTRDEINLGKRKGPRLIICGPFLDGPKKTQRSSMTVFITNETQAIKAVDSLHSLGVDFIKTHNGLSRETYIAIVKRANIKKLKVVSHLPKGIAAWEAANYGVSCIEHAAESILASPIYAGYVKTPEEAANWWLTSPKADSVIELMVRKNVYVTPTLIAFKTLVESTENHSIREKLEKGLTDLMQITLKLHRGGIRILAGSDFNSLSKINPGKSIHEEINLLIRAGLTEKEANDAASKNFELWLQE